jgi:hypothetical protein
MIKMKILLIGLVTALFLLTAVPAMATSVDCSDCSMQVVVKNNSGEERIALIQDDKCMPVKSAQSATLQPGDTFTGYMRFDKDAAHCQEIGVFAHNNGYFVVGAMNPAGFPSVVASSKWEVQIEAEGNGETIWFGNLYHKKTMGNLDCQAVNSNKLTCSIN